MALAGASCLVALAILELLPPRSFVLLPFHEQFIPVPVGLAVISGLLALRTYAYGGSQRTLAYGLGFVAFAAIYLWHGAFTTLEVPFGFLVYGPLARIALATALLLGISTRIDPREARRTRIVIGLAACLLLGGLGFAAHPALEGFALGVGAGTLQAVRRAVEGTALLLAGLALVPMLRRADASLTPLIPFGLTLNAGQSLLFLASDPWDLTWWTAHAVGGLALAVLAWAVVVVERDELRAREASHWREIADFQAGFINTAAHELRTPLMPLTVQVRLLKTYLAAGLTEEQKRSVALMDRNLTRLSSLVEDLLGAARYQAGKLKLVAQPVDLASLAKQAAEEYEDVARERRLDVQFDAVGQTWAVADAGKVRQILSNLLGNAVKFTPAGGRILIAVEDGTNEVNITVKDSGIGISSEGLTKLFKAFSQVHDVMQIPDPGTGLGLYISKALVELHGGTIAATSDGLGQGTTFLVRLPKAAERKDSPAASGAPI